MTADPTPPSETQAPLPLEALTRLHERLPLLTPGDWTTEYDGSVVIGGQVCVRPDAAAPDGADRAQQRANAQVMAAAKDLVYAALAAVATLEGRSPDLGDILNAYRVETTSELLDLVLAKAIGPRRATPAFPYAAAPGIPDQYSDAHHQILERMERRGGGFVSSLAAAWMRADAQNHAKLYEAFGDYYREYAARHAAHSKAVDNG